MFQSKKPNSSRGVRHERKFRLRTEALRDTRCPRAVNTQLPRVIAERVIHHVIVNGWVEFWSEPMKLLVDKLNQAYWLRILHNWNCQLLRIVLNYFGLLLVLLGG